MKKSVAILLAFAFSTAAQSQTVQQSGKVTPGHVPVWVTNGVVKDGGTAASGAITSLGVTFNGSGICQNSGAITGAYNQLCLDVTSTGASLDLFNHGGATGGFAIKINGTTQGFPVLNLPVTTNDAVCFANTAGNLKDCTSGGVWTGTPIGLAYGGLGGSQAAATVNQVPVYPGSGGAAVPTSAPTWFDNAYCSTIGYLIVRTTGAWTCSQAIDANPVWWGADSTGTSDSVAALNSAITAIGAKGRIKFPGGIFKFASAVTVNQALEISCAGEGVTTLFTSSTTADLFDVTAGNFFLHDCNLGASVTKSAGIYLNFTSVSQIYVNRVFMNNWFTGISVNGTAGENFRFRDLMMTAPSSASSKGIVVTTPVDDFNIVNTLIQQGVGAAQGAAGIEIVAAGNVVIDNVQVIKMGNCLNVAPTAGLIIQALFVSNSLFDSCSGNGINVISTGAAANVELVKVTSSWMATNVNGVKLATSTGGVVTRIELLNNAISNNSSHGILISDTGVTDTSVSGGCMGDNVTDAFNAAANVTKFQIIGTRIGQCGQFGPNGSAIVMAGTNSQYLIADNDLTMNTAYGINATTPGSGLISNNNTGSNGTAGINGVTPSAAIICSGNVGGVDACSTNSFQQLGKSGVLGSLSLGNATSGLLTVEPVTGALGTVTASLPANTGTIAELNLAQAWTGLQTFASIGPVALGWSSTAPTITSGFCSTGSPVTTVDASNGTAAFDILVGAATCGSAGSLTMPSATTGWVCDFHNVTNPATNIVEQNGGTQTTVTVVNYVRTTGVAGNFTAADHVRGKCVAY